METAEDACDELTEELEDDDDIGEDDRTDDDDDRTDEDAPLHFPKPAWHPVPQ